MYKRAANANTIDEVCREMFVKNERDLETIPPTSAAPPELHFLLLILLVMLIIMH